MSTPTATPPKVRPSVHPQTQHTTISGTPVKQVYTADDVQSCPAEIGMPGQYPFTRGVHETMYRGRQWTMRQFAGFGTASQTNQRFHFLLERGQTGLSTAFDMPTLMGLDSDDPRSVGEVGRLGVAIDSLDDMLELFDGIDLAVVSTSMTINAPAAMVMAMYLAVAQEQGVPLDKLRGTIQNDTLKEFHAQNEFIFPPAPSVGLVVDVIEYCAKHVPQWNPVSISGYHIREAGSTAAQELAFTLADGFEYVERSIERGLSVDEFAPRLSFFFNAHNEFLEEIAKYRAARRIWAKHLKERYGATDEKSGKLRFHAQTAGVSLQAQQPEVNLIRVAYQAMAAVLGGCQSLHTNSMDETLALPSEHAVTLALRTQQVLANETGITRTADPLGGSHLIEAMTDQLEAEAEQIFKDIKAAGGMQAAVESGYFRMEIAEASARYQREVDAKDRLIVGVNAFKQEEHNKIELHRSEPNVERDQIARLQETRKRRDETKVKASLDDLRNAAKAGQNLMPVMLEAAHRRVTVGESVKALAEVFGTFRPTAGW